MKKIYTLMATALFVGSISAANAEKNEGKINLTQHTIKESVVNQKMTTRADEREGTWESIGTGTYREGLFSDFLGMDPQDMEVEIEQNKDNEIEYRLVNPYANWEIYWSNIHYDYDGDYYIYFNIEEYNGKKVWYINGDSKLGISMDKSITTQGTLYGMTNIMAWGDLAAQYGVDRFIEVYGEDAVGVYDNGVLTYPLEMTFTTQDGEVVSQNNIWVHWASQQPNYGMPTNDRGTFTIAMPGSEIKEYDPFEGYALVGECKMQQNFFANYFEEKNQPEGTVEVYEDNLIKGVLHIKNAFVAGDWNTPAEAAKLDFVVNLNDPTFGYIDWQSTGYNDVDYGATEIMSTSRFFQSYTAEQYRMTKEEFKENMPEDVIYIDKETKRIIFPVGSVCFLFPDAPEDSEVYGVVNWAEQGQASWLQLPANYELPSAIGAIVADDVNTPVKYYNMQGMEVANPEAGQLVIVKKGAKANKVIF